MNHTMKKFQKGAVALYIPCLSYLKELLSCVSL